MTRARARVQPDPIQQEAEAAQLTRKQNRRPSRDPVREAGREVGDRGIIVEGRDGEQLTRRRTQSGDLFHIPASEIPDGWTYQWNVVTVTNQEMISEQNEMYENGWRPVPASRHPGRWTKKGVEGAIIVKGLRLEERPSRLTEEALEEAEHNARQQVADQVDALSLKKKMPKGFESGGQYRGTGGDVRMTIDRSMEVKPGDYKLADE